MYKELSTEDIFFRKTEPIIFFCFNYFFEVTIALSKPWKIASRMFEGTDFLFRKLADFHGTKRVVCSPTLFIGKSCERILKGWRGFSWGWELNFDKLKAMWFFIIVMKKDTNLLMQILYVNFWSKLIVCLNNSISMKNNICPLVYINNELHCTSNMIVVQVIKDLWLMFYSWSASCWHATFLCVKNEMKSQDEISCNAIRCMATLNFLQDSARVMCWLWNEQEAQIPKIIKVIALISQ